MIGLPDADSAVRKNLVSAPAWRRIMRFYTTLKPGIKAMKLPLIVPVLQRPVIQEGVDANWFIPAGESIQVGESIPAGKLFALPRRVVERLLSEADGIFAMHACPCRTAFHCQAHPHELGCLHLGPAVRRIPADVGRTLTLPEALEHLDRALSGGLTPTILHMPSEAEISGLRKRRCFRYVFAASAAA